MPEAATLSVLMPVHNGARFLDASINSILAQRFSDFEFLIVDDGSFDDTPAILAEHAASDPRIRIITQPRSGLVAALNLGLDMARSEWVARMDADDIAWPARLERQSAFMQTQKDAAAIGSFWRVIDANGKPRRVHTAPTTPSAIAAALQTGNPLAHPTMLLRRQAVLACGGYRAAFPQAEDYDLWLRLSEQFEIHVIPEVLLDYREHAGQANWRGLEQRILSVLAAQFAAAERRAGRPDPFPQITPIGRQALFDAGIRDPSLAAALIEGSRNAALIALAAGQGAATRAALRLLFSQPGVRWKTRLHGCLLSARSLFSRHSRKRSL